MRHGEGPRPGALGQLPGGHRQRQRFLRNGGRTARWRGGLCPGTGVGNCALGWAIRLSQWEVPCPKRPLPTLKRSAAALDLDAFLLRGSEPRCHERLSCWERIRIDGFPDRPSPERRRGPKCVWVSLFSEGPARGWSKMRLSLTVLAGFRRFRADSDAFWTRRPERPRIRPRLRRISDHRATGQPGHCPGRPRTTGPQGGWQKQRARRLRGSPALRPRLEHEELSRCHRYPATGDDPVVSR